METRDILNLIAIIVIPIAAVLLGNGYKTVLKVRDSF